MKVRGQGIPIKIFFASVATLPMLAVPFIIITNTDAACKALYLCLFSYLTAPYGGRLF